MSVYGIMRTSTSGMAAQADRMGAMADNIANVSTTGYKRASTEFSTLIPQQGDLAYQAGSVEAHLRRSISEQGGFNYTQSVTDLAVNGDGFFVVEGVRGDVALTRAGSFIPDQSGELRNAAGYKLLGSDVSNGGAGATVNGAAGLVPINLRALSLRATPSSEGALNVNLPSAAAIVPPGNLPSSNAAGAIYSAKTSLVGYDNLGTETTLDLYFAKTGPNAWEATAFNRADAPTIGEFPYASAALATIALTFDPTNGALAATSATSIGVPIPNGLVIDLDLSKSTQLAGAFSVQAANINGNAPVAMKTVEVSEQGVLTAVYEDGTRIPSFRIPLGRVPSPDNMTSMPGNIYLPSLTSGAVLIGDAASGGAGTIVSGALEQSAVDLASELTTMIEAQRGYTANSKVFQTGSELMDVIVNLRR